MCGIAGTFRFDGRLADRGALLSMASILRSRGPDGTGLLLDGSLGLVNTRLAIVDLAGGDQPIGNEDGRFWVVHNGEVYNHIELRKELEALGHRFATRCDTEVLVHAWEEWGRGLLDRLNGAFAFAIWDRRDRVLFLARDRFGIRPLYWARRPGVLHFASELKALTAAIKPVVDPAAVAETFATWAGDPSRSFLEGASEVPPGHWAEVRADGSVRSGRWWDLRFEEGPRQSVDDAAAELLTLLEDATRLRLRADVPVGVYLSGGLDSSATAALARRLGVEDLRSFCVSFADARYDESEFQTEMAQRLGTRHTTITIDGPDIAGVFPDVCYRAERPILRTAPAPLFLLSAAVQQAGLKVVLTGEGADEVFAGYHIFREMAARRFWARRPESRLRPRVIERLYPYLARNLKGAAPFFARGLNDTGDWLYSHRLRFENTARCYALLSPDVRAAFPAERAWEELHARLPANFDSLEPLAKAQMIEIRTFLQGYLLHAQGDRMLMAHSVEGRFPFLDYRLAEFAARQPARYRMRGLKEKYLLRRAVGPLLPDRVARRVKRPYRAPIAGVFFGPKAPDYVRELLAPEKTAASGLFAPAAVDRLVAKFLRAPERVSEVDEMALVGLLSTLLLQRSLVSTPSLPAPREPNREIRLTEAQHA